MYQISDSELIIMKIIWSHDGEAMFAEVSDDLKSHQLVWKKNTRLTYLSRLVEKEFLKVKKTGRRNSYISLISEDEFKSWKTKEFIGSVYEGNVKGLVSTLVENELVSSKEAEEIKQFWNEDIEKDE